MTALKINTIQISINLLIYPYLDNTLEIYQKAHAVKVVFQSQYMEVCLLGPHNLDQVLRINYG
jgi:hypothetical protein